jgi:molybdopterin synthase sulfur carrier subunit
LLFGDTMRIKLRLFSIAKDLAGFEEKDIALDSGATPEHVLEILSEHNKTFERWKTSLRFAVNYEYVSNDHPLNDGDEVAVIPPVSGG